jgi:tetratricopeptide (TPR) repeat protein
MSTQAVALNAVGWQLAHLGDFAKALELCQQAHALHVRLGDRYSLQASLDSVAFAYRGLGRHAEAADCYRRAVALLTELGSDYEAAVVLTDAGDAHCDSGDLTEDRDAWGQALAIFERLRHPNASKVAAELSKASYGDSRFIPHLFKVGGAS